LDHVADEALNYPAWVQAAHAHLAAGDGPLAELAQRQGPVGRAVSREYFSRLSRAILGQQISTKAAAAIYGRFLGLMGDPPGPAAVLALSDEALRGVGLSGAKVRSVRDLAERALDGRLDLVHLETLSDDAIVEQLVAVRGIGRWTAEMFLMFSLGRPDVLAADDLGIQVGIQRLYGWEKRPTPTVVRQFAEEGGWHPYATEACFQLWESLHNNPPL
jgi:DNA-3-methyladenine glycosylase II